MQPLLINKSLWKQPADISQHTTSKRSIASPFPTLNFHSVCVTLGAGPLTSPNLALVIKWHICLQATWENKGPGTPVLRTHVQLPAPAPTEAEVSAQPRTISTVHTDEAYDVPETQAQDTRLWKTLISFRTVHSAEIDRNRNITCHCPSALICMSCTTGRRDKTAMCPLVSFARPWQPSY